MIALLTHKPQRKSILTTTLTLSLKQLAFLPVALLLASCSNDQPKDQGNNENTATQTQSHSSTTAHTATESDAVLRIAAAANLAAILPTIIDSYQHDMNQQASNTESSDIKSSKAQSTSPNVKVMPIEVTYASSGKLYAQINAGAPYDIFLSADQQLPAQYIKAHPNNNPEYQPFTYARGQLALYSSNHELSGLNKLDALSKASLENLWLSDSAATIKITLANPELAPYGASAKAFLQQIQLYDALSKQKKLIQAENIGQAFQYAHTASTDYGFVALSQLISAKVNPSKYKVLAADSYPSILQDGVVVSDHPQAVSFTHYLQSGSAQQLFKAAGYLPVNE